MRSLTTSESLDEEGDGGGRAPVRRTSKTFKTEKRWKLGFEKLIGGPPGAPAGSRGRLRRGRSRRLHGSSERAEIPRQFAFAWEKGFRGILGAVLADLLQDRLDSREATEEAVAIHKRNSLFFLLLNILDNNRCFEIVSELPPAVEGAGTDEPLWKIVMNSNTDGRSQPDALGGSPVEVLAKAQEEGQSEMTRVMRRFSEQRRGNFNAWHDFWSFYRQVDKSKPDAVTARRPWQQQLDLLSQAQLPADAKEKLLKQMKTVPSFRTGASTFDNDDLESQDSETDDVEDVELVAPTELSRRRMALVDDYNPLNSRMSPVRCYKNYQDHKKCRKVLKNVTLPTKCPLHLRSGKEYSSPRRMGLSLSRLPVPNARQERSSAPTPLHFGASTARGDFRSMRCRLEHKQAAIVSEPLRSIKQMASEEPSSKWQPGTENWVHLRSWREERGKRFGGENMMLTCPLSFMKAEMPEVKPTPVADFHRPWSAERDDGAVDGVLPPLQRYAKVCMDCGLQPQQAVVGFLGRELPFLDLRSLAFSDEDFLALTAAFPHTGTLERLDLGDNSKISDRSACPLLQCVAARYADKLSSLRLDRCIHIGRKCIQLLTRLIHGPLLNLQRLDISGVYVSIGDYQKLANAIERHERLREVSLARTGISPDLSTKVLPNLVRNSRIVKMDLGYNHFDPEAFNVLGNSLLRGSQVEYLGLAKTASVMASQPMAGFLEQLPADKSLKYLDLSDNMLDESSAMMLECGLQTHPAIEFLDVSTNPLGQGGLGSLARLLSSEKCQVLTEIRMEDVQVAESRDVAMGLFEVDPSGQYCLEMAEPGQRTCFRLLLSQLSEYPGSRSLYIKSATLSNASYNVDGVRRRKNIWTVPSSGTLDFVLSLYDFLLKDEGDHEGLYSSVVERMFLKRKRRLLSKRRALVVLQKVSSLKGPIFDAFVMALLHYFQLSTEQVMAIYMNQGDKAKETLIRMLPSMMAPQSLMHVARNTDTLKELLDFEQAAEAHMALNLENPTGHYSLRMESLPARVVVQHLMLLNRWQLHLWRKANLVDVSMDGKGKCLRNTLLDGRFVTWAENDWRLPASGQLSFDFVALYRPPANATAVAPDAWGQVLAALADLVAPKVRGGDKEDPFVRKQVAKVQWALRALSSRVWLLTRQLRNLLCVFLNRQDRGEVLTAFFLRCVDWPINNKCCQPKFSRHHWKDLSSRLGYMNVFPYGQPEMSFHVIDLEKWEQRRCFHTLVRLAAAEDSVNIKNPMMDKDANPNTPAFQPFVAGIPKSWDELDNIPMQGLVQCTYNCAVDRQNLKVRRRLAASVGGWSHLPDTAFDLWSCLEDVPLEVLKVVMFMIRQWGSTDGAFAALNTQPDNMLNHKEFVDGLAKAGCCRTRRPKKPGMPGQQGSTARPVPMRTETEEEADPAQMEALSSVFRYLDTSHDGDISSKEFETLERVWRELQQSMYELKRDLTVFYGSLQTAFEAIDLDESGAISFEEFKKCVAATHFDGPVQEIFMFIDLNGDTEIDGHEFWELDNYSHAPPLPDHTDGKLAKLQRLFR